jgi:hypothetical protein
MEADVRCALGSLVGLGLRARGRSGRRQVGQAEVVMSCELEEVGGRPCDPPWCAVSTNP